MKVLVVIPARGGSKGIPEKNIKFLSGKPLIQYTIEAARQVFSDNEICVSTDDKKIKQTIESIGLTVPFLRPPELSTDNSGTYEVLLHAVSQYEKKGYLADTLILLQATSPFRTGLQIKEALQKFDSTCELVVSVKETKSNPYWVLREENKDGWLKKSKPGNFIRRQDCPIVYELNGAIYIMHVDLLKQKPFSEFSKVRKYVMDEWSSHDIDTMLDWEIAEVMIKRQQIK